MWVYDTLCCFKISITTKQKKRKKKTWIRGGGPLGPKNPTPLFSLTARLTRSLVPLASSHQKNQNPHRWAPRAREKKRGGEGGGRGVGGADERRRRCRLSCGLSISESVRPRTWRRKRKVAGIGKPGTCATTSIVVDGLARDRRPAMQAK